MKPLITKSKAPILHQQHQEDRQCFEVEWMIRFTDAVFGITHFESINFQALKTAYFFFLLAFLASVNSFLASSR